jgi:ferredoxin
MIIEKIKDNELREKMTAMTEMVRQADSEFFQNNPQLLEKFPHKDDFALWLPKATKIKIDERVAEPTDMVLPYLVLEHFIRQSSYRAIMNYCPCREVKACKDYPIEYGCLFLGDAARDIHPDLARNVTVEEALDYGRRCREIGLIHHLGYIEKDSVWLEVSPSQRLMTVCHCCPCCCGVMATRNWPPEMLATHSIRKMPGVEVRVTDDCIGCGTCVEACPFQAVRMEDDRAVVTEKCVACGRCADDCPEDAIEVIIEDPGYVENAIQRISEKVDCT